MDFLNFDFDPSSTKSCVFVSSLLLSEQVKRLKTLPLRTLREKHLIEQRTMGHLHVRACALMGENL